MDLEVRENNMQTKIKQYIEEILKELELPQVDFDVELPKDISHGDFSTNIALVLSKQVGKNPRQVAEQILNTIQTKNYADFSQIEIAGPGFINFYLSKEYFENEITKPISKIQTQYTGKKIITEYTDPNPFKQFHIGHLMSNTIGESVSRLYELGGAEVTRVCYQGDIGPHVAKCVWGMIQNRPAFPHDTDSIEDKMKYLGESYVYGSNQYEDNESAQAEIKKINKKLFEKSDLELQIYYDKGRQWSLEYFETIYKKLGTEFKHYFFESETFAIGKKIVEEHMGTVFEKSEESEAIIYKGEKDGLHTRVFINSQGLTTYETKELGLAFEKEKVGTFDTSVVVTASEQTDYFKVLLAVIAKIKPEIAHKMKHVTHGMMQFADGKMSSRKGNVITADTLLDQIGQKVTEKIAGREYSEVQKQEIISKVSIAALKYSILKQTPGKNIIFDFEKSISFEGDSGPYIQYAYTRAQSILAKANSAIAEQKNLKETYKVEKILIRFESVVSRAINELAPQLVANYLVELAGEFNSWYANERIIGDENESYKLLITKKVSEILKSGLDALGIKVTNKM
jgi:arginyl-tRNA synthetase